MSFGPIHGVQATGGDIAANAATAFAWPNGVAPEYIVICNESGTQLVIKGQLNCGAAWVGAYPANFEFEVHPGIPYRIPNTGGSSDPNALKVTSLALGSTAIMHLGVDFTVVGYYPH